LLVSAEHPAGAGKSNISMASVYITAGDRGVNTTNLYSNNPTVERHAGRLLPIAERVIHAFNLIGRRVESDVPFRRTIERIERALAVGSVPPTTAATA
jgi:hypothetical protein